jgi:non-heme chloroperoxidase
MHKLTPIGSINASRREVLLIGAGFVAFPALALSAQRASPTHSNYIHERTNDMGVLKTKDGTEIFYKDWGTGQPIVFHHGWPLSSDDWDTQMLFFLDKGYRVTAHDRRGLGRSTQTATGNDMEPDVWNGMASANVSAPLRWKRAKIHRGSRR